MAEFAHPFTCLVGGPSQAGKTELVKNIILHADAMISPAPQRIIWYYAESQPKLERDLPNIEFRNEMPQLADFPGYVPTLIVVDDFMSETDNKIVDLFTKGSHHRNLSVFFLVQNVFHKKLRSISINTQYLILFRNPRDLGQIRYIGQQMGDPKGIEEAFEDATRLPHGYLLLDMKQQTPRELRYRTDILPHQTTVVYKPKRIK